MSLSSPRLASSSPTRRASAGWEHKRQRSVCFSGSDYGYEHWWYLGALPVQSLPEGRALTQILMHTREQSVQIAAMRIQVLKNMQSSGQGNARLQQHGHILGKGDEITWGQTRGE